MSDNPQVIALLKQALAILEADAQAPLRAAVPLPSAIQGTQDGFDDYGRLYDFLRGNSMLGPKISVDEYKGTDAIVFSCLKAGWPISWTAYALATAYHETAHTMQPITEYGGPTYYTRMYDINGNRPAVAKRLGNLTPGDGAKYPGQGYVQLTGKGNYAKATAKLRALGIDCDLVAHPEQALDDKIAATIMVCGMAEGWFTGRKLADDLPSRGPATHAQFVISRDIINGTDRADLIAGYADQWQTGLQQGGYRLAA